jgi:hypothetical protein
MKPIFLTLYFSIIAFSNAYCQSNSENALKKITQQLNNDIKNTEFSNGIRGRNCLSIGNTIIIQYDVPEYWQAPSNIKQDLISNLKATGAGKTFYLNNIQVVFHYFKGNLIVKKVSIEPNEFSDSNLLTGEFISIKNHPKAKGVNLKLKVPISWEVNEGDRPNIVKKIVKGGTSYLIQIRENATFLSRKQANEAIQDEEVINSFIKEYNNILKNPRILDKSIVTVDTYPTIYFKLRGDVERLGLNFSVIINNWIILYEDKFVMLQSMMEESVENSELQKIFFLITNSVVFPDQYE